MPKSARTSLTFPSSKSEPDPRLQATAGHGGRKTLKLAPPAAPEPERLARHAELNGVSGVIELLQAATREPATLSDANGDV